MNAKLVIAILGCAGLLASPAWADGELHIYNWGDYTSPDLIKKFEQTYNVKVTITDYDFERYGACQGEGGRTRLRHRRPVGELRAHLDSRGTSRRDAA